MGGKECNYFNTFRQDFVTQYLGHKASYKFRLFHLLAKRTWPFGVDYFPDCSNMATAFRLNLMFNSAAPDGSFSISYKLERKDTLDRPLDAFMMLKIFDANGQLLFHPRGSFGKNKMKSGEFVQGNATGVLSLPQQRNAFNELLVAHIDLVVYFCHSGSLQPAVRQGTDGEPNLASNKTP